MSFGFSNAYAEENVKYEMIGDITPVLTFQFREGTVTHSPLLHKAMDESYIYRFSNSAFDHQYKYFDIDADFMKEGKSILSIDYRNCRIDNYNVETLDSNDYESYFAKIGFAIVDKIDFVCSGLNSNNDVRQISANNSFTDYGKSGFKFANNMTTSVTFMFENGIEKNRIPCIQSSFRL
jgi:hypothetical protein